MSTALQALPERTEIGGEEDQENSSKIPRNGLTDVILCPTSYGCCATPPTPWSPWRTGPPPPDPRSGTTTATVAFGRTTPPHVGDAPIPFP
jgi:hypothetical protein